MTKKELITLIGHEISPLHLYVYANIKNDIYLKYDVLRFFGDITPINTPVPVITKRIDELNIALNGSGVKAVFYINKQNEQHTIHLRGLNNKIADKVYALLKLRGYFNG